MGDAPTRRLRSLARAAVAFMLLHSLPACDRLPPDEPLDGGFRLHLDTKAEESGILLADRCWRRERGGWHYSIGHCAEMLPPRRMTGIWVTGFEESSFFPGDAAVPNPDDGRRFRLTLEVEEDRVLALAGPGAPSWGARAFALGFVGRRTRYPVGIDCYGGRYYGFVADRLDSARYLGEMGFPQPPPSRAELPPYRGFRPSGEGGVVGRMEQEALRGCMQRIGAGAGASLRRPRETAEGRP
ncbi:MAG: hypothetical protein QOI38_1712 [Sphingomonadales bacterium]|jgi:hypothetical protein|nr:hypothetical protein [Sphingomonadales bacterium]